MQVQGPIHLHGAQRISSPHSVRTAQPAERPTSAPIVDEVQISEAARMAEQAQAASDPRQSRIAAIRQQIAAGVYETPDKLDAAIDRLFDEIG